MAEDVVAKTSIPVGEQSHVYGHLGLIVRP